MQTKEKPQNRSLPQIKTSSVAARTPKQERTFDTIQISLRPSFNSRLPPKTDVRSSPTKNQDSPIQHKESSIQKRPGKERVIRLKARLQSVWLLWLACFLRKTNLPPYSKTWLQKQSKSVEAVLQIIVIIALGLALEIVHKCRIAFSQIVPFVNKGSVSG